MENKECKKCGEVKSLSMFYKNKNTKDGYTGQCALCFKTYNKANEEKIKVYNSIWQRENREKINKQARDRIIKNPGKMAATKAALKARNIGRYLAYCKKYRSRPKNKLKIKERYLMNSALLTDTYVVNQITKRINGLSTYDTPQELIELKRAQLKFYRATKK